MLGSLIGGALAIGSALYGGKKASEAMNNVKSSIEGQKAENQAWYDRRYNEDPLMRTSAQRVLANTQKMLRESNRAAAGRAAVAGGTEESVAAEKERNNEALADAASRIAAQSEARKDAVEQQYMATKQGLTGQLNNLEAARANAIAQATGAAGSAAANMGAAIDDDLNKKVELAAKLAGGLN